MHANAVGRWSATPHGLDGRKGERAEASQSCIGGRVNTAIRRKGSAASELVLIAGPRGNDRPVAWMTPAPFGDVAVRPRACGAATRSGDPLRNSRCAGTRFSRAQMNARSWTTSGRLAAFPLPGVAFRRLQYFGGYRELPARAERCTLSWRIQSELRHAAQDRFAERVHRLRLLGKFPRWRSISRRNGGFVYHLHGSVHYSLYRPIGDADFWQDDLTRHHLVDDDHSGIAARQDRDGKLFHENLVAAGSSWTSYWSNHFTPCILPSFATSMKRKRSSLVVTASAMNT